MTEKARFFVDERGGCIAIRDRELTDPDYPGLHSDTPGVVLYWNGEQVGRPCPTCRHVRTEWFIDPVIIKRAVSECEGMNRNHNKLAVTDD